MSDNEASTKRKPIKRKAEESVSPVKKRPRLENKRPADINYSLLPKRYVGKSSKQMIHCQQILKELMTQKQCTDFSWPFLSPVDDKALEIPDYYKIVKNPMDLSTVKKKYNASQYANPDEFYDDVMLVCSNCFLYNKEGDFVHQCGKQLEAYFLKRWKEMPVDKSSSAKTSTKSTAKTSTKSTANSIVKSILKSPAESSAKPVPKSEPIVKPVPKSESSAKSIVKSILKPPAKSSAKPVLIEEEIPVTEAPPEIVVSKQEAPASKAPVSKVSALKPIVSKEKSKKKGASTKKTSPPIPTEPQLLDDSNDNEQLDVLILDIEKEKERINNRFAELIRHGADLLELKHKRLEAKLQKSALPILSNELHSEIRSTLLAGLPPLISMDFGDDKSDAEEMPAYKSEFNNEPMSYGDKKELAEDIGEMPQDMLKRVEKIIRKSERGLPETSNGDVDLDFGTLKPQTLRELKAFVNAYSTKNREATDVQSVEEMTVKKRDIEEQLADFDNIQPIEQEDMPDF